MAFSRVYVGVHYPGDVAGGLILGAVTVLVLWPVAERSLRPVLRRIDESPLAILLRVRSLTQPPWSVPLAGGPTSS